MTPLPHNEGPTPDAKNPRVFLDIKQDGSDIGRLTIELFANKVPKTAENFRALCTGEVKNRRGKQLHYKGSRFFAVTPGHAISGGDIVYDNGSGGESIYGLTFPDENFSVSHDDRGIVSMNSAEFKNTNSSQFSILLAPAKHMDKDEVAFGKLDFSLRTLLKPGAEAADSISDGFDVLDKIEAGGVNERGEPNHKYVIADCGQIKKK